MKNHKVLPENLAILLNSYKEHLSSVRRLSDNTLKNYIFYLNDFLLYCVCFNKNSLDNISIRLIRDYLIDLKSSKRHSARTVALVASSLKSFFKFCELSSMKNLPDLDTLSIPKANKNLPIFLSEKKALEFLNAPKNYYLDFNSKSKNKLSEQKLNFLIKRATLFLYILYCSGIRISELCNLKWQDINFSACTIRVLGKGKKSRITTIGKPTCMLLEDFKNCFEFEKLNAKKKNIPLNEHSSDFVFILKDGSQIYPKIVQTFVKKCAIFAGLPENITPHKMRHTFATHLVSNGADLRIVQELLGHSSLSTTQIYTHLDVNFLKSQYKFHPHS